MEICQVIGIDLGTTNSCVAGFSPHDLKMEIIPNSIGERLTPSWIAFTENGRLYGKAAVQQYAENPEHTVYDVKRVIGRKFDEEIVKADRSNWAFEVIKNSETGLMKYRLQHSSQPELSCEELSGCLLRQLKRSAKLHTKRQPTGAVITVPARFGESQRRATKDAAKIGGLKVLRLLNEPTAAAIAYYGLDHKKPGLDVVLVYDLGGGTFDVSVLQCENEDDDYTELNVKATGGDTHLGGRDFDESIARYLADEFQKEHGLNVKQNLKSWNKLLMESERAKIELSYRSQCQVNIDDLMNGISLSTNLTRARLARLIEAPLKETKRLVLETIKDAGYEVNAIKKVLLVGGSTRIPEVKSILSAMIPSAVIDDKINPDEVVARGAALLAAQLCGFSNRVGTICLTDVTPLSLGVAELGSKMGVIIARNSVVPARETDRRKTVADNQTSMLLKVYEGERPDVKDNYYLGELRIAVPANVKGAEEADVTFILDDNCLLRVIAKSLTTGEEKNITIDRNQMNLSAEEVAAMLKDADKYAERDEEWTANVDAKLKLSDLVYGAKKSLKYLEDKELKKLCEQIDVLLKLDKVKPKSEYETQYRELEQKMK